MNNRGQRLRAVRMRPLSRGEEATVTVVIPCFNYGRFLPGAVNSVLDQKGVAVNIIVVDDASEDDSLTVARRLADCDSRVRVVANSRNRGPVRTFNAGLALADGEFLVRLDADDLLTPGSLRRAVAVMQTFPTVGLVFGHPVHFVGRPPTVSRGEASSWTLWKGDEWLAARCRDGTNTITSPEVVMRRSVVDVVGGQKPLAHTHDMEMWLRIAAYADVGRVDGADQAWHRDHPASLSTRAADPLVIHGELRDAFDLLLDDVGDRLDDAEQLRRQAHQAVATSALDHGLSSIDRGEITRQAEDLVDFAESRFPGIRYTRRWRRARRTMRARHRMFRTVVKARGVFPRLRRRMQHQRRYRRWVATGDYNRMVMLAGTQFPAPGVKDRSRP